jgi:hypothetical protein
VEAVLSLDGDGDRRERRGGYEFGYGPPFVLGPVQVKVVAQGLAGEGWGFGAARADGAYEGFEALGPFYAAAALEGKAVVGGVR